jgi:tRNA threonylcarbamoyladenosine biosynthesis protein TsaB
MLPMTATLLAIDTTTDLCSVALSLGGQIYSRKVAAPREHAQRILSLADGLLAAAGVSLAQLDGIAYGCGPGSFTGIRIATGIAQGLAFGVGVPVVPISTLRAMAWVTAQQFEADHVMAALDARQREVYWGLYTRDKKQLMKLQGEEGVFPPEQVPLPKQVMHWVGAGPGWQAYQGPLTEATGNNQAAFYEDILPEAEAIVQLALADFALGHAIPADKALPTYLRDRVVG